ncbi:TNF receptor-associated factor 3-like [Argopecten irradians]|uniref:TNF receptor-associated factor 3-like n=1 Tax=Argopecten irradians TaxID=31199 RepID=UPI00371D1AE1
MSSDLPDFVNLDNIYLCTVCKHVLEEPYQLVCGHHVCAHHLQNLFINNNSFTCPGHTCDVISEHSQVFPDGGRKREIMCLPVRCPYRIVGCEEIMEWRNLQRHYEMCGLKTAECPNRCGEASIPRRLVRDHLQDCPLKPTICPYSDQGCPFKGNVREVREHEEKNVSFHLSMAKNDFKIQMCKFMEMFEKMRDDNQDLREQLTKSRAELREMKKLMAGYGELNINMKRKIEDHVTKDVTDKLCNDVSVLKNSISTTTERVNFLERTGPIQAHTAGPVLTQLERQVALNDSKVDKLDLDIRLLETTDYTGTLMWKVSGYQRRKQEAISGKIISIYSQPFYSSRYGYRMCARVYLHGDGSGKGTHLSFFFVVMKGDHDELLLWPFSQQVTMLLLDQSGTGQDIRETFTPSHTGSSFQRPRTEMNMACGVPQFCPLDRLESDMYLRNDTIFLMVKVDCTGLRML